MRNETPTRESKMSTRGGAVRSDERKSCRSCEYCGARASHRLTLADMDEYGFFVDPTHAKCVAESDQEGA